MNKTITILVVIDQTVERKGLSYLLNDLPSIAVIGEASTGQEAVQMARAAQPDVILLSQELYDKEGPSAVRRFWQDNPGTGVLILSAYDSDDHALFAYETGLLGFVHSNSTPEELALVIQAMTNNGR